MERLPRLLRVLGLSTSPAKLFFFLKVFVFVLTLAWESKIYLYFVFKRTRWHMPVILALSEWGQEHHSSSLDYLVTPRLNKIRHFLACVRP